MSPHFRAGTWDENIWKSIVDHNEYGVTGEWPGDVLDIGAHIGSFSHYATEVLKARHVIAVEPDPANYALLLENVSDQRLSRRVTVINAAVGCASKAVLSRDPGENTGGGAYVSDPLAAGGIPCFTLDELLPLLTGPVLLKIDCEGCEYGAILNSKLEGVARVVGEYHYRDGFSLDQLRQHFDSLGFEFSSHGAPEIGLFGAHRRAT